VAPTNNYLTQVVGALSVVRWTRYGTSYKSFKCVASTNNYYQRLAEQ